MKLITSTQLRASLSFVTNTWRTLQFVRRCYGLRGIYGRFDSKIRLEIESDGRFDSRFHSNAKKTIRRSLHKAQKSKCALTRRAAVLINFSACDRVCAKLHLHILKVGRFSIGWFMLTARLVRAHLDFCASWGQTQ